MITPNYGTEADRKRADVRLDALRIAHDIHVMPDQVVKRATAYIDFVEGKTLEPVT